MKISLVTTVNAVRNMETLEKAHGRIGKHLVTNRPDHAYSLVLAVGVDRTNHGDTIFAKDRLDKGGTAVVTRYRNAFKKVAGEVLLI